MQKDLHELVGLGSPPAIYTKNASEALNSVLKKGVNCKESQWPNFVKQMKQLVDAQHKEVIRALSGRGQEQLSEKAKHLRLLLKSGQR